ncbi:hypothetical protein LLG10_01555 [bacterium]|nr:hypothetical protein [bacterium]
MKNKVLIWMGIFFLVSLFMACPILAEPANTENTPNIPIQVTAPSATGTNAPSTLPQDMKQITPPTSANTSVNPNTIPQPVVPAPQVTIPGSTVTTPSGTAPATPPNTGFPATNASPAEPVLNNYTKLWYLSPWFISLIVIILIIVLLVVYSLFEGKIPKEEKEPETVANGKKKKAKK